MLRYAITGGNLFGGDLDALLRAILAVAQELDYLQIRERELPAAQLEDFTDKVMHSLQPLPRRPRVLINHRADVALAAGADGVHLRSGSGELLPAQVRELYRAASISAPVVSVSCHSLADVRQALAADLILFGAVFEKERDSPQSPLPGVGLDLLAEACRIAAPTPVLALGGVTIANQLSCLHAGAAGAAGIRRYFALSQPGPLSR